MITVSLEEFVLEYGMWIWIGVVGDGTFRCIFYRSIFATVLR